MLCKWREAYFCRRAKRFENAMCLPKFFYLRLKNLRIRKYSDTCGQDASCLNLLVLIEILFELFTGPQMLS